ncbi:MAG: S46 family peptidase, partial [Nitrososphaerales archaeon]
MAGELVSSMKKLLGGALSAVCLSAMLAGVSRAAEGMWTFDNFPSSAVKARLGVDIDASWLSHVRGAALRLSSGCSASVVSGAGLVLTNHHCVRQCIQQLSSNETDYLTSGFSAAKRQDERLCPGMQAEILTAISNVTSEVQSATAGKSGRDFVRLRDAKIAAIENQA